jgi:PKD repeat protein
VAGEPTTLTVSATPQHGALPATSYDWDCESDGAVDATTAVATTSCTYATAGSTIARVTARGGTTSGSGTVTITVQAAHDLFVVLTASTLNPSITQPVTFTATVSSAGPIPSSLRWYWDHTNNGTVEATTSAASPTTHSPPAYGVEDVVTFKVRVVDEATGREATTTLALTVGP